jgi:hypothetical protein
MRQEREKAKRQFGERAALQEHRTKLGSPFVKAGLREPPPRPQYPGVPSIEAKQPSKAPFTDITQVPLNIVKAGRARGKSPAQILKDANELRRRGRI